MASLSVAIPISCSSQKEISKPSFQLFFNPLPVNLLPNKSVLVKPRANKGNVAVEASFKEKVISGVTAGALTAVMIVPDVAEAASGVSPSLKNFLLSIGSGGVVVLAIIGAIVGVSNFDPVNRA